MQKIFDEEMSCEQLPSQPPLFGQVIDRLNYLNLNYTELTNYAYAMTSKIANAGRLCEKENGEYKTDGSIISNLMVTMDKLEDNMNKLKLVVKDLEQSII